MDISNLPDQILEEIFSYLLGGKNRDLLTVTEVCKRFNTFVGNSRMLMQSITILWDGANDNVIKAILESNRRYTRMECKIISGMSDSLLAFLERTSITYLEFNQCEFKHAELWSILNCIRESIEVLNVYNLRLSDEADSSLVPIFFPNLRELDWQILVKSNFVYEFFRVTAKLKEFAAFINDGILIYNELFVSAVGLKKLLLEVHSTHRIFENAFLSGQVTFKLEELTIYVSGQLQSEHVSNFTAFLKTQTLLRKIDFQELKLTDDVLEAVLKLPALTNLGLDLADYRCHRNIPIRNMAVKKLFLHTWFEELQDDLSIYQVIKACPLVTEVEFSDILITEEMADEIIKHMKQLLSIKFSLQECMLTFEGIDGIVKILKANLQLKKITIAKEAKNHAKLIQVLNLFYKKKVAITYCR